MAQWISLPTEQEIPGLSPVWAYFLLLFSFYDSLEFVLSVVKKMAGSTLARPFFSCECLCFMHAFCQKKVGTMGIEPMTNAFIRPTLYRLSYAPWCKTSPGFPA